MSTTNGSATKDHSDQDFVITRVFDAPRDLVFKAWTDAESMAQWWGPKGYDIIVSRFEFRPGGIFHYRMQSSDGHEMWGRFVFREILAPERIVFINSFADEEGNIIRAPFFDGIWPLEVLNTVTLTNHEGGTMLELHARPLSAAEEELRIFHEAFKSMEQGYGGTLDQLADFLSKTPKGTASGLR
jgi:uncharacterized protein YndB with AHSA1/START domain